MLTAARAGTRVAALALETPRDRGERSGGRLVETVPLAPVGFPPLAASCRHGHDRRQQHQRYRDDDHNDSGSHGEHHRLRQYPQTPELRHHLRIGPELSFGSPFAQQTARPPDSACSERFDCLAAQIASPISG
jgi:hypothetical protein